MPSRTSCFLKQPFKLIFKYLYMRDWSTRIFVSWFCILNDFPFCFLDVEDIKFVINYDYPNTSEDYIHRIGRTGRVTQSGTAITFFTPDKQRQAKDLIAVLKEANQSVNPHLLDLARLAKNSVPSMFLLIFWIFHHFLATTFDWSLLW